MIGNSKSNHLGAQATFKVKHTYKYRMASSLSGEITFSAGVEFYEARYDADDMYTPRGTPPHTRTARARYTDTIIVQRTYTYRIACLLSGRITFSAGVELYEARLSHLPFWGPSEAVLVLIKRPSG